MSRPNSGSASSRRYALRRYNMTLGYAIFYALMLTAASIVISRVFASTSFSFGIKVPEYLYASHLGLLYIYNLLALAVFFLVTLVFPAYIQLRELETNQWYVYARLGISTSSLAWTRVFVAFYGILRIYLVGFAVSVAASMLLLGTEGIPVVPLLLTLAVGALAVTIPLSLLFLLASLTHGKLVLSAGMVIAGGLVGFLLYHNGYLSPNSLEELLEATDSLVSLQLFGLLLIAVALAAVCIPAAIALCVRRASVYNIEELDADTLISMDVQPELLILEKGKHSYEVAISGAGVHNLDIDIPVPPLSE